MNCHNSSKQHKLDWKGRLVSGEGKSDTCGVYIYIYIYVYMPQMFDLLMTYNPLSILQVKQQQ